MKSIALICFLVAVAGVSMSSHAVSSLGAKDDGHLVVVRPW